MSIREQALLRMTVQRMACTSCGAQANASCNCGVAYVPKRIRAAEAIKANPEKSDRAIAADLGIARTTVQRARDVAQDGPPERIGRDGKSYPAKPAKQDNEGLDDSADPAADVDHETGLRVIAVRGFFNRAAEAKKICTIDKLRPDDITEAMIEAAYDAAAAWEIAAYSLRGMKNG